MENIGGIIATDVCVASDFRVKIKELDGAIKYLVTLGSKYSIEPHVTLLLNPTTEAGYNSSFGELKDYLRQLKPFEITLEKLEYEPKNRFVKVEVNGDMIKEIHQELLEIVGKYRHGEIRSKDLQRMRDGKYTNEEIAHLRKYGFLFSGDKLQQKITIGNVPETENDSEIFEKIKSLAAPILGQKILIDEINLMFHTDAPVQSEMKVLKWETIKLG